MRELFNQKSICKIILDQLVKLTLVPARRMHQDHLTLITECVEFFQPSPQEHEKFIHMFMCSFNFISMSYSDLSFLLRKMTSMLL